MLGHICTDINQGALPAMLPFLIVTYDLSYASAAAIVLASSIVSSVIQPLFGALGDKLDRPWFMSLGILLAGGGLALLGFVQEYWLMLLCAGVSGIGVALFHPEGGKLANYVAGEKKGAGISNFSVGGNLGFATGPVLATFALGVWGINGTLLFIFPTVIMAAVLLSQNRHYEHFGHLESERRKVAGTHDLNDDWSGFVKVTIVNFFRSIVGSGLIIFIPLYWINVLGQAPEYSALMLTLYSGAGAVATFFGGRIADRIGFKKMILISFCALGPFLLLFVITSNLIMATILIVLTSLAISAAYSPIVALGQSYLPNRLGLASGISLGVVVSVGGITSPIIGAAGDAFGLTASMVIIVIVAFGAGLSSLLVVRHRRNVASKHDGTKRI
jgi:FSR family fosmidomycin resistance protein-like MFS transporter